MRHWFREMNPAAAETQDAYLDRLLALRQKLERVPVGRFTIWEWGSVRRIMAWAYDTAGRCSATTEDFDLIEKKLAKMQKRRKTSTKRRRS